MVNGLYGLDLAGVCSLPAASRYDLLVKESARREAVWGLWAGNGWYTFTDGEGHELAPVWPGAEYAEAFGETVLTAHEPRRMSLDYWMDNWVTSIMNKNCLVSVFPAPGDTGRVVTPVHLLMDVRTEASAYSY